MTCSETGGAPACNSAGRVAGLSPHMRNLVSFSGLLSDTFGVSLQVPETLGDSASELKKFCGGLLEPSGRHPWAHILRALPAVDRLSIAGSLFSFRKTLPSSDPDCDDYVRRMSVPGVKTTAGYLRFVTSMIKREFKVGWDRGWRDSVLGTTPTSSSALGSSKKQGGARVRLRGSRQWFLKSCIGLERELNLDTTRTVGIARCDGKARRVTQSPAEAVVLSPLHKLLYNHLSSRDWLLRGEATPDKFSDFVQKDGEVFVSGDYESASDNLSIEVAEAILSAVFSRARFIPQNIRRVAMDSLRCVLVGPSVTALQARGQLMGNFLCFPLLCLQNYIAFRYLAGNYPVRINGDDIVFRAPNHVRVRWALGVQSLGLTLSAGKTFVHRRFFSLNSTYFRARVSNGVKGVPIVRATLFYKGVESADSIVGRFRFVAQYFNQSRGTLLRIRCLQSMQKEIRCTQRSVRRGLGLDATPRELAASGLYPREVFLSNLPRESAVPGKLSVEGALPPGWVKVRPRLGDGSTLVDDPEFRKELVRHCWDSRVTRVSTDDYWNVVRNGGNFYRGLSASDYRRKAKLLGLTVGATRRYLTGSLGTVPPRRKGVWRRATNV
ncbi:RNA-dependent RNA polymerase [Magnaporthe oryzae botourmiavirus 2]|uniref:RNA-dependent RNA polymerase n=1 Tax=Magnaporthe oryzae botourmiavirus 2 TaxID=2789855 RepID=A0A7S8WJR8_9VIRU|nr:RNA-dependent RNA polymerase [Magnaporthe oryzae botourmiavirus 2]QPF16726.1 RNA-dependent RNA polymerase [Magnaporthe oryzae botourmiavirus 2]